MAEFALVAPIFFFVMLGLIELGRAVYYTQVLDSAARDGTRYAIVHGFQSFCPSGPMPGDTATNSNLCDPNGVNVISAIQDRAFGVTGNTDPTVLTAHVKWCSATDYQSGSSQCYDWLPCPEWTTSSDPSRFGGLGDGDNNRSQLATVCVSYSYQSLLSTFLPIPDFTVTGRATLVVNN